MVRPRGTGSAQTPARRCTEDAMMIPSEAEVEEASIGAATAATPDDGGGGYGCEGDDGSGGTGAITGDGGGGYDCGEPAARPLRRDGA